MAAPTEPRTPAPSTFARLARRPLRLLTRFGGAALTDRLGLRQPAADALFHTAKAAATAATTIAGAMKAQRPARLDAQPPPSLFDLTPTDEQGLILATVRRFADDVLRPAAAAAAAACAATPALLAKSTELALAPMLIPEAHGGVAETRSTVTATLIASELARGDLGLAVALLAPLAVVDAIVRFGTGLQQQRLLPRFAGDAFVPAALAVLEPRPGADPTRPQTGAVRDPDTGGWKLYGAKALVPLAATAELLVVVADVRGVGPRLFVVEKDTKGVTITPEPAMGVRAAATARVTFDGATIPRDALLGGESTDTGNFDQAALDALVARSRIAWAAVGVGAAQAVLDYVKPYVNERKAFGEPISHRQAVAFAVADIAIELDGMRLMTWRAAALADRDHRDLAHAARLARAQVAAKGMQIGSNGVQLLGGHGYVKEFPVERWYRDLRAIAVMEGAL